MGALGEIGPESALKQALQNEDPEIRLYTAKALKRLKKGC